MTTAAIMVIIMVVVAAGVFVTEIIPIPLVALSMMAVLVISQILSPEEGFSGFSNSATVTVAALFVLSAALFKTGALDIAGTVLARVGKRNWWIAVLTMMAIVAGLSAFVNHTAVVAIFIPIVHSLAHDIKVSPSKLMMPMAFASMLGGVCTLIGSTTNILVNSIAQQYGQPPFGMFEFTRLGLIFFCIGTLYTMAIGVRLIPERVKVSELETKERYLAEMEVLSEGEFVGRTLLETPLVKEFDIESLEIYRGKLRLHLPPAEVVLQAGDHLHVRCDAAQILKLKDVKGMALKSEMEHPTTDAKEEKVLVEAVIAPSSFLVGMSLHQMRFSAIFGTKVHALRHRNTVRDLETAVLSAGDVLLIEANQTSLGYLREQNAFVVVSEVGQHTFRRHRMLPAVAIVGAVVVLAATGMVPLAVGAVAGAVILVLSRCLTLNEAYGAIDWNVIFLLAGVLPLGRALEKTGAALTISRMLIQATGSLGPVVLVSVFYLLTTLLTEMMSNKATVAILAPIAITTAHGLGLDARPFLIAVTFAGSAAFMTPVGHQVNTLIYGPGRYKFTDYLRVGTPLTVLLWVAASLLIPFFWSF